MARRTIQTIRLEHLGGTKAADRLQGIVAWFYERCLITAHREFPRFGLRRRLRPLCEDEFISDAGRRRLCEESKILRSHRIPRELLTTLVNLRLIRKRRSGGRRLL